ncbi:Protein GRIP [Vitis vinifera]|uniref:Protein GRIP n=1 Tax=Vitis vinifera TaxID=29760 RepID=A0A438DBQ6_VITVI|nr:Protein GRIP [Vitis vinifera]
MESRKGCGLKVSRASRNFSSTYLEREIQKLEWALGQLLVHPRIYKFSRVLGLDAVWVIKRLESEFSSYKVRAHALLQKKEAELAAAKDSEQLKAQEEALKEAEKEILLATEERDRILRDLQDALANHDKELATRCLVFVVLQPPIAKDAALSSAKQQIKSIEKKLDSANARYQSEKEAWEINLQNLEETWRLRCEALAAQNEVSSGQELQKELEELNLQYKRLKAEHESFRDLAERMIEGKDNEISKLLDENKTLQQSLESRPAAYHNDNYNTAFHKQEALNSSTSAAEQQILLLARQQAQREEELAQSQRHILALQEEIEELERENRLHSQQEAMLKEEFRNMERMQKREGVDMTYLKNVILKLLETGEVEALLPVIGMLLQFSPEEVKLLLSSCYSITMGNLELVLLLRCPLHDIEDALLACRTWNIERESSIELLIVCGSDGCKSAIKHTTPQRKFLPLLQVMLQDLPVLSSQDSHFHNSRNVGNREFF